jgi:hypothetical protein
MIDDSMSVITESDRVVLPIAAVVCGAGAGTGTSDGRCSAVAEVMHGRFC